MEKRIRVLIVEDNRSTCALLRAFLGRSGPLEVCGEAHNGREGLRLVRETEPDLVLLDLVMPVLDGLGFLEALRGEPDGRRPKVLVLSGVGSDEFVQRAIRLGASYYLMKPVYLEELAARLSALFPEEEDETPGRSAWLLLRLGANRDCLGFRFACLGVELLASLGDRAQMKEVYLRIAEEYTTTWSCVERNLRTTVRQVHAANTPLYRYRLGFDTREKQPDNSAFIRALAKALR